MKRVAIVQKIKSVEPIEGDDSIERVCTPDWQCTAEKGKFHDGDMCIYFPESNTIMPAAETLRARGTVLAKSLADVIDGNPITTIVMDVTEILGIDN